MLLFVICIFKCKFAYRPIFYIGTKKSVITIGYKLLLRICQGAYAHLLDILM